MRKLTSKTLILALLVLTSWGQAAVAFQILTPESEPCHESIMLGALDAVPAPFGSTTDTSLTAELQTLLARATVVPGDKATKALINEVTSRFNLAGLSYAERYIIMSFVVGVRFPDTNGFAVVKFNETRNLHIRDDNQPRHSLRKSFNDLEQGSIDAIANTISEIKSKLKLAHTDWNSASSLIASVKWTFSFYGEVNVNVFIPAFLLGQMSHAVQDSYSHTIRDENLNILSVMNFVDVILSRHDESRDGPGHSDRMDTCKITSDAFDAMRVEAARSSTADLVAQSVQVMTNPTYDSSPVDAVLNSIYSFKSGCDLTNQYCGSDWFAQSQQEITEPFDISGCSLFKGTIYKQDNNTPPGSVSFSLISLFLILAFWLALKWLVFKSENNRAVPAN